MADGLESYLGTLGGAGNWDPLAILPGIQQIPGYELGIDALRPAQDFLAGSFREIWTLYEPALRDDLIQNVLGNAVDMLQLDQLMSIAQAVISGIGVALAEMAPYLAAALEAPGVIVKIIGGTIQENDQRRRDERLAFAQVFSDDIHPKYWTRSITGNWSYTRAIAAKKDYRGVMIYPPGSGYPLNTKAAGSREGDDCRVSMTDFSGLGSCRWDWQNFPMLFPYFHGRCWGEPSNVFRGMERSSDAGAAVIATWLQYQTAMLSNPIVNLMGDGKSIMSMMRSLHATFWKGYRTRTVDYFERGGVEPPSASTDRGFDGLIINMSTGEGTRIHESFRDDALPGLGDFLYLAPNGLIGAYTDQGSGSTTSPVLSRWKVPMYKAEWMTSEPYYFISAADYNAVMTIFQTFFATRRALLRDQGLCKRLVSERPMLLEKQSYRPLDEAGRSEGGIDFQWVIPEGKVRAALRSAAVPRRKPLPAKVIDLDSKHTRPPRRRGTGGGGVAPLAAAGLGLLALSRGGF